MSGYTQCDVDLSLRIPKHIHALCSVAHKHTPMPVLVPCSFSTIPIIEYMFLIEFFLLLADHSFEASLEHKEDYNKSTSSSSLSRAVSISDIMDDAEGERRGVDTKCYTLIDIAKNVGVPIDCRMNLTGC